MKRLFWNKSTTTKNRINCHIVTKKAVAFTLAEVLITLGIVGVVAALVITPAIKNINSKVRASRIQNIEQKIQQATAKMGAVSQLAPYSSTTDFVTELSKHMKLIKICNYKELDKCWPSPTVKLSDGTEINVSRISNPSAFKMTGDGFDDSNKNVGFVTADGVSWIITYDTACPLIDSVSFNIDKANSASCVHGIFDWNGKRKPNRFGIRTDINGKIISGNESDVIGYSINGLGSVCTLEFGDLCLSAAFSAPKLSYNDCLTKKDKLGISLCFDPASLKTSNGYTEEQYQAARDKDNWGGVVNKCGGVDKLPSAAEILPLISILYGGATINSSGWTTNIQRDYTSDIAIAIGFTSSIGSPLWTRGNPSNWNGPDIRTNNDSVFFGSDHRYGGGWGICLVD